MTSESLVYNVADAMRATKLSRTTIYKLIKSGRLAATKIGRRVLIPKDAIKDLLK